MRSLGRKFAWTIGTVALTCTLSLPAYATHATAHKQRISAEGKGRFTPHPEATQLFRDTLVKFAQQYHKLDKSPDKVSKGLNQLRRNITGHLKQASTDRATQNAFSGLGAIVSECVNATNVNAVGSLRKPWGSRDEKLSNPHVERILKLSGDKSRVKQALESTCVWKRKDGTTVVDETAMETALTSSFSFLSSALTDMGVDVQAVQK